MTTNEQAKMARRKESRDKFDQKLNESFGGTLSIDEVANRMGVPITTIQSMVDSNELISFKRDGVVQLPAFQLDSDGHLIGHLNTILPLLKSVSGEAKCSFFLTPITLDSGRDRLPLELMVEGCSDREFEVIKREAAHYFTHIAT